MASRLAEEDYEEYAARVRLLGLEVGEGRGRVNGAGKSSYFQDYDSRWFERHAGTLEERLTRYNNK